MFLTRSDLIINQCKEYVELGLSVIPIHYKSKRPLIKWLPYTQKHSTIDNVHEWIDRYGEDINIGIVTGAISNLIVFDIDSQTVNLNRTQSRIHDIDNPDICLDFSPTVIVKTGKGFHFYYSLTGIDTKYPNTSNRKQFSVGVDTRCEHGYVVAPPSIHSNGQQYNWYVDSPLYTSKITNLPTSLRSYLDDRCNR